MFYVAFNAFVDVCDQSQYKMTPKGIHVSYPKIVALIRKK